MEYIDSFCTLTRLRGTLLEERLGIYRFIHLAFQEFLAAPYLVEVERDVEAMVRFFETGPDSRQLVAGTCAVGHWLSEPDVAAYRSSICPASGTTRFIWKLEPVDADIELPGLASAARALLEWLPNELPLRDEVVARINQRLTSNAEQFDVPK